MTGGTGVIGPSVARQLLAAGHAVRVLARRIPPAGVLPDGVVFCVGDVTDPDTLPDACEGVDTIIHLASLLHVSDAPDSDYERINVGGTTNLLAAAGRAGVRRFVLASTIAVYGHHRVRLCDEATPLEPDSPYGRSKRRAEEATLSAGSSSLMVVVLRLAAVYGPSMRGNYRRLLHAVASGRFIPIGRGTNLRTLVHEDDAAAAFVVAACHPDVAGRIYNVTDGECHTVAEILGAMSRALGRRPPRVFVPLPLARAAGRAMTAASRVVGRTPPAAAAAVEKYVEHVAVAGDRIQRELGFHPQVRLQEGWQATVDALHRTGALGAAHQFAGSVS